MKDFSLPKIGNFELTQQEKTIVGKEETSKINTVKNETTFILEMKLSFEVVARGHEQDILLCVVRSISYTSSRVLLLLLKETRVSSFKNQAKPGVAVR